MGILWIFFDKYIFYINEFIIISIKKNEFLFVLLIPMRMKLIWLLAFYIRRLNELLLIILEFITIKIHLFLESLYFFSIIQKRLYFGLNCWIHLYGIIQWYSFIRIDIIDAFYGIRNYSYNIRVEVRMVNWAHFK